MIHQVRFELTQQNTQRFFQIQAKRQRIQGFTSNCGGRWR